MLAYVYGVVPISLCRSGGCGVSAGNGKGVRIEFDENDMAAGSGGAVTGEEVVLEVCMCVECSYNSCIPLRSKLITCNISGSTFKIPRCK